MQEKVIVNKAVEFNRVAEQSMKVHIFGTCSGTEPVPNRHHTAFAIEWQGELYWFDAGETCSYTACMMGLDLLKIKALFISHPHLDHTGGLVNLIGNITKLNGLTGRMNGRRIDMFFPDIRLWQGTEMVLGCLYNTISPGYELTATEYQDGVIYQDNGLTVTALHNHHLAHEEGAPWKSFGFAIDAGGKRIVYTGDTKGFEDYKELLPCDLLLTETGHHSPEVVAQMVKDSGLAFGKLCFIHHGRDILADPVGEYQKVREILGERVRIMEDQMTLRI